MGLFLLLLTLSDGLARHSNNVYHHDSYQLVGCVFWGYIKLFDSDKP